MANHEQKNKLATLIHALDAAEIAGQVTDRNLYEAESFLIPRMVKLIGESVPGKDFTAGFQDSDVFIIPKIMETLKDPISYKDLENLIAPELIVKAFTLCSQDILQIDLNGRFCREAEKVLKLCSPDAEKTEEYKMLLTRADQIASEARNILFEGDTIETDGSHITMLPLLLQQFAAVKGSIVKSEHFTAAPLGLSSILSDFNGCAIVRPQDGDAILVTGRKCQPLDVVEHAMKALGLTK